MGKPIIQRERYVAELLRLRGNGLVKVVTGIRRCGKSFLLFRLFKSRLLAEGVPADNILELLPLRKSGDFFRKIVVVYGSAKPREDAEGIVHVGIIPFLLDESILAGA